MRKFKVEVYIRLKEGITDPEGEVIKNSLKSLGYLQVERVRMGKFIVMEMKGEDKEEVEKSVDEMCKKFLANLVIEKYWFRWEEV